MGGMNNRHQWGCQRTDELEESMLERSNVITRKARGDIDNIARNQSVDMVTNQYEIGPDSRNLGIRMGNGSVKGKPSRTMYTPSLVEFSGDVSASSPGRNKNGFSAPKMYTDKEWHGWNMGNVGNFSRCARNLENDYDRLIDCGELSEGSGPQISLPYSDYGEPYGGNTRFR